MESGLEIFHVGLKRVAMSDCFKFQCAEMHGLGEEVGFSSLFASVSISVQAIGDYN